MEFNGLKFFGTAVIAVGLLTGAFLAGRVWSGGPEERTLAQEGRVIVTSAAPVSATEETISDCIVGASICEFTSLINSLVLKYDFGSLVELITPTEITCRPGLEVVQNAGPVVCDGQPVGTVVEGYRTGIRNSHAFYVSKQSLLDSLTANTRSIASDARDDFGAGSLELLTVGTPASNNCEKCHQLIFSYVNMAEDSSLARKVLVVTVSRDSEAWVVDEITFGLVLPYEAQEVLLGGKTAEGTYVSVSSRSNNKLAEDSLIMLGSFANTTVEEDTCIELYQTPSLGSESIICLDAGTKVEVIGGRTESEGSYWWLVRNFKPGVIGWISAEQLTYE